MLAELDRAPHVIFTTAYDEYALKAFEVNALDYLLKPVEPKRLADAIQKLEHIEEKELTRVDMPVVSTRASRGIRPGICKRRRTLLVCKTERYSVVRKRW